MNDTYYRVGFNKENRFVVCCLQWFDEWDYDDSLWITDEKFDTEESAYAWLDTYKMLVMLNAQRILLNEFASKA